MYVSTNKFYLVKVVSDKYTGKELVKQVEAKLPEVKLDYDYHIAEIYENGFNIYFEIQANKHPSNNWLNAVSAGVNAVAAIIKEWFTINGTPIVINDTTLLVKFNQKSNNDVKAPDAVHSQARRLFGNN